MRRKITWWTLTVLLLTVWPSLLPAQARLSGEINGIATDDNGDALPGVTIKIFSEKMFQKSQTAISGDKGLFRFLNLNAGIYTVGLELQGFNPIRLTNVEVRIGQTTSLKVKMIQASLSAEVKVIAQAPLIDTKTPQLATNYTIETIEKTPTNRNLLDLMDAVPAINDRGAYGSGGNEDSEYYKGSSTSAYLFNGVDVSDQNSGATWVNPNYDTIEEIQVVGVGAPAEYGNFSGAVLNVITKKGSNQIRGGASLYYTSKSLQGDNSAGVLDLKPNDLKYNADSSLYLGGPIIKEKLFFFIAGGYSTIKNKKYGDPEYSLLKQPHFQAKLDWVPTAKHSFSFLVNSDPLNHDNLGLKPGSGSEIGYSRQFRSTAFNASWQFLPNSQWLISLKYAGFIGRDDTVPVSPDTVAIRDRSTNRAYGSSGFNINNLRDRHQVNAVVTHYADDFLGASHEFKFGAEFEMSTAKNNSDATGAGGTNIQIVPYGPFFFVYGFSGYNIHTESKVNRAAGFIQDNVQIGRKLNLNLGLRLDSSKLTSPGVTGTIAEFTNWAPRLGLTYDLTGDAKNVLRMHFGRYYDKTVTSGFLYALPGVGNIGVYATFLFSPFEPTSENIAGLASSLFQARNLMFTIAGRTRLPVASDIHSPYTDVLSIGFEKSLFDKFALSVDYIYKRDRDLIRIEDRATHTYQQVEYTDPYLHKTVTLWQQTDRTPADYYYTNSGWAKRRHHLLTVSLRKREVGPLSFMSSFVFQDSRGNDDNSFGPVTFAWGQSTDPNFTQNSLIWGKLTYNRTYQVKTIASYTLPWGMSVSGDFRILSGLNWEPQFSLMMTGIYRESIYSIPLEQRGSRRFPTTTSLNLRLSQMFSLSGSSRVEIMMDVLNAFNRANAVSYYTDPSSVYPLSQEDSFGLPAALAAPIQVRFGLRWTF